MARPRPRSSHLFAMAAYLPLFFLILALVAAEDNKCASESGISLTCPNCGGIQVTDCSTCTGYEFPDYNYGICYDRKLFHVTSENNNNEEEEGYYDPDNHYPFLWNDIIGGILWFLTAAIAVPCGVGGGAIYVPLGILLLRFPPKASSGLSQASVFGACLGGLLVNIRNMHPNQFIRDVRGILPTLSGTSVSYEMNTSVEQIQVDQREYLEGGDGKRQFYTRPIIDYDLALFLAPMDMAGAVLGMTIQRLLPNWLYAFTCCKTYEKFFKAYKVDKAHGTTSAVLKGHLSEEKVNASTAMDVTTPDMGMDDIKAKSEATETYGEFSESDRSIGFSDVSGDVESENIVAAVAIHDSFHDNCLTMLVEETFPDNTLYNINDEETEIEEEKRTNNSIVEDGTCEELDDPIELEQRRKFLQDDSRQYPKEKLAYLGLLWAVLTMFAFLKGGKGAPSVIGITCEDAGFHILGVFQSLWAFGFAAFFGHRIINRTKERLDVHYPFDETNVLWDSSKVRNISLFALGAGFIGGLIGISSGYFIGPILILYGVHPSITTATTATMSVLTSSGIAVLYVMSGLVPWEYATYLFLAGMSGAYIGKTKVDAYLKKTGMVSLLIGALATIIAFATIGCIAILLMGLEKVNWCLAGFNDFCTVQSEDACPTRLLEAEELFPY